MKKFLAIVMALLMVVVCFAACSEEEKKTPSATGAAKGANAGDSQAPKALATEEILAKSAQSMADVKEVGMSGKLELEVGTKSNGLEVNAEILGDFDADVSLNDKLMHMSMDLNMMGESVPVEMYIDMNSPMTVYTSMNGKWVKQTFDEQMSAQLDDLIKKSLEIGGRVDFAKFLTDLSMTENDDAYEITFKIDIEKYLEAFDMDVDTLLSSAELAGVSEQEKQMLSQVYTMVFDCFADVPYTMGVDKNTFYTVYIKADMTEVMQSLMNKLMEMIMQMAAPEETQQAEITVTKAVFECTYRDFNAVDVTVPQEVLGVADISTICQICGNTGAQPYEYQGGAFYFCEDCFANK